MPLERMFFTVYLDDPDRPDDPDGYLEHRVEVRGADQLRGELEGKRIGVTIKDSMHQTYLWAWAACVRTGLVDLAFKDFRDVVISVESDKDDPETVDPTQPAPIAGSPSSSPAPTPEPATTSG